MLQPVRAAQKRRLLSSLTLTLNAPSAHLVLVEVLFPRHLHRVRVSREVVGLSE